MHDLRLIGVHEDGMHLILGDEEGSRFSLPLDEPLRAAARHDHPRLGQLPIRLDTMLRPKDVQAMIRAGLTAEEVAERAGWTVEKVHRYEGPILAEREHVAGLARQVRLRSRGGAPGATPTLGERVTDRLRSREIDANAVLWDSRRADRGRWTVVLTFNAGGRQREAVWDFDPLARIVTARDDEARWLSEDEAVELPGPIPAPHLKAPQRPSQVYDVEAEGGIDPPTRGNDETVDLMAAMRERSAQRGRRRRARVSEAPGIDHAPVEALPLSELTRDAAERGMPPAVHPHADDELDAALDDALGEAGDEQGDGRGVGRGEDREQADRGRAHGAARPGPTGTPAEPRHPVSDADDWTADGDLDDEGSPSIADEMVPASTRPDSTAAGRARREAATEPLPSSARRTGTDGARGQVASAPQASPATGSPQKPKPPARKSGRPSVPSWDDIVFGRKPD
jgi:hypothetical protein